MWHIQWQECFSSVYTSRTTFFQSCNWVHRHLFFQHMFYSWVETAVRALHFLGNLAVVCLVLISRFQFCIPGVRVVLHIDESSLDAYCRCVLSMALKQYQFSFSIRFYPQWHFWQFSVEAKKKQFLVFSILAVQKNEELLFPSFFHTFRPDILTYPLPYSNPIPSMTPLKMI